MRSWFAPSKVSVRAWMVANGCGCKVMMDTQARNCVFNQVTV